MSALVGSMLLIRVTPLGDVTPGTVGGGGPTAVQEAACVRTGEAAHREQHVGHRPVS